MTVKRCGHCHDEKSLETFYRDRASKTGLSANCKSCALLISRHHYYNNIEKERQRVKIQRCKNPRRTWSADTVGCHRKRGHEIKITIQELYNWVLGINSCKICGVVLNWELGNKHTVQSNSPTLDRIDNGNTIEFGKIQILCHPCNTAKRERTMAEFIAYCHMVASKYPLEEVKS
jgi:hypothetical protein